MSDQENSIRTLGEGIEIEIKQAARAVLGDLAQDAGSEGMVSMIAELGRGAVLSGRPELLDELRDVLPWLATYHRVGASRTVLTTLLSVAGNVVRAGILGLSSTVAELGD